MTMTTTIQFSGDSSITEDSPPTSRALTVVELEQDPKDPEEYSDEAWYQVAAAVREAEAEVLRARELVHRANAKYGAALAQQDRAQHARDIMIVSDPRKSAAISRLAGISRPRVSQIRTAHAVRSDGVEAGSDSQRLLALIRKG